MRKYEVVKENRDFQKIIEQGNHEELLEKKGRYFELYTGLKELD